MEIELICSKCDHRFAASADTPEEVIVQRMTDEGPWYALGEGKCFLDMIHTALIRSGRIICPECGGAVWVQTPELLKWKVAFASPSSGQS